MGKRKIIIGVIVGAIAGGLTTLFDSEARAYTKSKLNQAKATTGNLVKNPSQTVGDIRSTVDRINNTVTSSLEKAINTLYDVEKSLKTIQGNNNISTQSERYY